MSKGSGVKNGKTLKKVNIVGGIVATIEGIGANVYIGGHVMAFALTTENRSTQTTRATTSTFIIFLKYII